MKLNVTKVLLCDMQKKGGDDNIMTNVVVEHEKRDTANAFKK